MHLLAPRCRHRFEIIGEIQRCTICGGECGHTYVKSGERIKTGSSGRAERYQELFTCSDCNVTVLGTWKTRPVSVPAPAAPRARISDLYG